MKKKIAIAALIGGCLFFAYYGATNFLTGLDLRYASATRNLALVLSRRPHLPLTRIFNATLATQYLNYVNFRSLLSVIVYFLSGFGIIEYLYLILRVVILFVADWENKIDKAFLLSFFFGDILLLLEIAISVYYALRVFLYANLNVYDVLPGVSSFYIIVGVLVFLGGLAGAIFLIYRLAKKR